MEARITEQQLQVRQVTHFQTSWTEEEPGTDGTFSVQLILDEGAATHVIRPTADDLDVLYSLMKKESAVYFDMERNVLMFQTQSIG